MRRSHICVCIVVTVLLSPLLQAASAPRGVRHLDEETFLRYWRDGKVATYFIRPDSDEKLKLVGELRTEEGRQAFTATVRGTAELARKLRAKSGAVPVNRTRSVPGYGVGFISPFLGPILGLIGSLFWFSTLIHCLWVQHPGRNDKKVWALLIVFTNVLGVFLYLFLQRGRTSLSGEEA